MAGIYIHVPFCKQACHYCNFHFSTNLRNKNDYLDALFQEMLLRKSYLEGEPIDTIYIGGGTPTLFSSDDISAIINKVENNFSLTADPEITIEANPDDLTEKKIRDLKNTPINRFSIGVQSFRNEDLIFMNRAHNATDATNSVKRVQDVGFQNITIDLIYGIPGLSNEDWESNLQKFTALNIPHLSAYCLTVEPNTALNYFVNQGKIKNLDEEKAAAQFEILMDFSEKQGYDHYEISNFAKPGFYSRHNSGYWTGKKYLGLGPSAHSYDLNSRQWNVSHNMKYINSLQNKELKFEVEVLTDKDKFNDYILTSLRTKWGIDLNFLLKNFDQEMLTDFNMQAEIMAINELVTCSGSHLILTRKGKLLADRIISDLLAV